MLTATITLPAELLAIKGALRSALPQIAEAARGDIVAQSQRSLTSAGADYAQNVHLLHVRLGPRDLDRGDVSFATIVLTGWLANAVEQGWAGGDMKPGLLAGRNAKVAADGTRSNVVPFRHGTPGSSGRSFAAMGAVHQQHGASKADAEQMAKRVYRQARQLSATTSHPGAGTTWGDRLAEGLAPKLSNRTTGYQHKTDIFAGMVRKEKTYAAATQNQYVTFRRVSDKSDPGSWVHPGIIRHDFFGKTARRVPQFAALVFDGMLRGMGKS